MTEKATEGGAVKAKERPDMLPSATYKVETGFGNLFVTITYNDNQPFELFAWVGKAGTEAMGLVEAMCKAASWLLRVGVHPRDIVKLWKGIKGEARHGYGLKAIESIPDGVARVLEADCIQRGIMEPAEKNYQYPYTASINLCPQCSGRLKEEDEYLVCSLKCGYRTRK